MKFFPKKNVHLQDSGYAGLKMNDILHTQPKNKLESNWKFSFWHAGTYTKNRFLDQNSDFFDFFDFRFFDFFDRSAFEKYQNFQIQNIFLEIYVIILFHEQNYHTNLF